MNRNVTYQVVVNGKVLGLFEHLREARAYVSSQNLIQDAVGYGTILNVSVVNVTTITKQVSSVTLDLSPQDAVVAEVDSGEVEFTSDENLTE